MFISKLTKQAGMEDSHQIIRGGGNGCWDPCDMVKCN